MKKAKKYFVSARHRSGKYANKGFVKAQQFINIAVMRGKHFSYSFHCTASTEEELWKPVAEILDSMSEVSAMDNSSKIEGDTVISFNGEEACISASVENGKVQYKCKYNNIGLKKSHYKMAKFRRVDENGSHRFYDLVPNNMGPMTLDIGVRFGNIGAETEGKTLGKPLPSCMYWIKYMQKLSEGYTDESDSFDDIEDDLNLLFGDSKIISDENDDAVDLYQKLVGFAEETLADFNINWLSNKAPYTKKQVDNCWKLWDQFSDIINTAADAEDLVRLANETICSLIKIAAPEFKKGVTVKSFLIKKVKSLKVAKEKAIDSLNDWENRIMAMQAVMAKPKTSGGKKLEVKSPFGNVDIRKATPFEFDHFKDLIATQQPHLTQMLKAVWIVTPYDRKKTYEEALTESENKTEREVFHGSVNSNMVSLLTSGGPTIRVNAANGRMFGNGSYWSDDFDKSLGYTSMRGSRWAGGSEGIAYMLVGKIHYGNPYMVYNYTDGSTCEQATKDGGFDCCHAVAGAGGLLRDEIITYDEEHSYVEAILEVSD